MKSIKRGRMPSVMSGVVGIIMALIFFVMAVDVSRNFEEVAIVPVLMGIAVLVISIFELVSATRKNRFSEYDITEGGEEPDPLNGYFGNERSGSVENGNAADGVGAKQAAFCPYCGAHVESEYEFCPSCGKRLP